MRVVFACSLPVCGVMGSSAFGAFSSSYPRTVVDNFKGFCCYDFCNKRHPETVSVLVPTNVEFGALLPYDMLFFCYALCDGKCYDVT
ncbi:hypothetical protein NDU88_007187 [Pleurodeles waltl]|uniref:Secreted protein n=1 Tax=Pleurodeles waltl TaxID=8319 RepID=A0AAV7QK56_PLEWA|nr:hypothetical protein NDU88_007187 [Pleurodeles waltl]